MTGSTGQRASRILALNCGSSSIKASIFDMRSQERLLETFTLTRIGLPEGEFRREAADGEALEREQLELPDHQAALQRLIAGLDASGAAGRIDACAHRVVHGGAAFKAPSRVDDAVLEQLERLVPLAPDHLPSEILGVRSLRSHYPHLPQVACFDTAFHHSMPRAARVYALPETIRQDGIQRYGFHGLSYEFILQELRREAGRQAADGRVVIAHLGSGASMAAVASGRSLDTTMGYTPAGGLVMGTRPGDLDPGVVLALVRRPGMDAAAVNDLINKQSGLFGLSGFSSDMRDLLEQEGSDSRAKQAIESFCYQARKHLGALIAVLGGMDTLVFTAGIGEHAPQIRQRILAGMEYAGIELDPGRNAASAPIISSAASAATVRVMHTDEDLMLARHAASLLRAG